MTRSKRQFGRFRGIFSIFTCAADERLPQPARFQATLARERARADRTGAPLALVLWPCAGYNHREVDRFVSAFAARLRATDDFGWLSAEQIGVILPDTTSSGAARVARDIAARLGDDKHARRWEVYMYPSDGPPSGSSGERASVGRDASEEVRGRGNPHPLETLLAVPTPLWKRGLDVIGALLGLVLCAPLMLLAALAVKLTSPGPILFRQLRSGRGGQPFVMYKFRSMVDGAEQQKSALAARNERDGPAFKIKHDPRTTPIGRLLRMLAIDELPQLWNVLRGEMSLVGPRPLPCEESQTCHRWQRRRLDVTPGLTCFWQVSDRDRVSFNDWVRMDLRYIATRSPWQDLRLLFQTLWVVVRGKGG